MKKHEIKKISRPRDTFRIRLWNCRTGFTGEKRLNAKKDVLASQNPQNRSYCALKIMWLFM